MNNNFATQSKWSNLEIYLSFPMDDGLRCTANNLNKKEQYKKNMCTWRIVVERRWMFGKQASKCKKTTKLTIKINSFVHQTVRVTINKHVQQLPVSEFVRGVFAIAVSQRLSYTLWFIKVRLLLLFTASSSHLRCRRHYCRCRCCCCYNSIQFHSIPCICSASDSVEATQSVICSDISTSRNG